jgi:hypothetical protein
MVVAAVLSWALTKPMNEKFPAGSYSLNFQHETPPDIFTNKKN